MKLVVNDSIKKKYLLSIFESLGKCVNMICICFEKERMYIQGMDSSHVCLYEISIQSTWFQEYHVQLSHTLCLDPNLVCLILSKQKEHHIICLYNNSDSSEEDKLYIDLKSTDKNEYNMSFQIALCDLQSDLLQIPDTEYDASILVKSKDIQSIFTDLESFGSVIEIKCTEEKVVLKSSGVNGTMEVIIDDDKLIEYSINEGDIVHNYFSSSYLTKLCKAPNKLFSNMKISLKQDQPLRLMYSLDIDSTNSTMDVETDPINYLLFFVAPKNNDDFEE